MKIKVGEAKSAGDSATSQRHTEKTLAGVEVSVRRRWLKGEIQFVTPSARWFSGQAIDNVERRIVSVSGRVDQPIRIDVARRRKITALSRLIGTASMTLEVIRQGIDQRIWTGTSGKAPGGWHRSEGLGILRSVLFGGPVGKPRPGGVFFCLSVLVERLCFAVRATLRAVAGDEDADVRPLYNSRSRAC